MLQHSVRDLTGTTLGHYEVKERLGVGGMAVVYRAVQSSLGREVALKVLAPALTEDTEFLRRFENEARTLASLDHPNILAIIDFDTIDGVTFLTMPLARGGSFEDVVAKGPMDPGSAWTRFLRPVADALGHAHKAGIVHRDLKPANVLIHSDSRPLLADFGLARVSAGASHLTNAGFAVGTPGYMAPEQVMGREVDARADIYAYAAMVFRALTGRLPYTGETAMEIAIATVKSPIPSATALRRELPDELDQFMQKALAKDPNQRPSTMAELVGLLNKVPQHRVAAPAPPPARAAPPAAAASAAPAPPTPPTPEQMQSLSFAHLQAAMAAAPPPAVGSAIAALELQGLPRLVGRERHCQDAFFANSLAAAREVCGPAWAQVASTAGLAEFAANPPAGPARTTPVELPSRLNEAFEIVFTADAADRVRGWGRLATANWLRTPGASPAGVKLAIGRQRKLEVVLKAHLKAMDEVRGEHLHAYKQIDENQFWLIHYSNLFALGRRKREKSCHLWTASLEALLRGAGLANDWLVSEIECGCVSGSFDCVFAFRSARG
jgi:Protein kinase domain